MKYFDLHTHCKDASKYGIDASISGIVNCDLNDDLSLYPRFSIGVHPWDVDVSWQEKLRAYSDLFRNPPFEKFRECLCAIGEIGLDKLRGGDLRMQKDCLLGQLSLASLYRLPVLIHCVKALDEVVSCLSDCKFAQPVIFHGFRGKPKQAAMLLSKGFFLSFGPRFNPDSLKLAYQEGRMFLETDDTGVSISSVYELAGSALSISPTDIDVPGIFTS